MTTRRLNGVLHHLREGLRSCGPSDGQLLERFLSHRDEMAFDTLVRRHGPMVLGVCRRLLKNIHDAEDAFQATFLVLVRKAASIRPRELVGHWLYGVAYRTALKAKALACKRSIKERSMPVSEAYHDEPPADWLPLLDEELQRLPDKYRLPLVLCDLDGKTRKEAARHLGWPDGTLSTRLTRARTLLAERLTKRGVTLAGGAAVLTILHGAASAQVPAALAVSTVKAAMGFAAGQAATMVSAKVAALTQGVLKTMLLSKLKTVVAVSLVLALLGVGAGTFRIAAGEQAEPTGVEPPLVKVAQPGTNPSPVPLPPQVVKGVYGPEDEVVLKLPTRKMPNLARVGLTPTGTVSVCEHRLDDVPVIVRSDNEEPMIRHMKVESIPRTEYSREDVQLYDTSGKLLPAKELPQLLKDKVTALVYNDGFNKPEPQHLKLLKEGTLIVVLTPPKATTTPPVPPAAAPPTSSPLNNEQSKLLKELQGEWRVVSHINCGRKAPLEDFKQYRYLIRNDIVYLGHKKDVEDFHPMRLKLRVHAASPNWFDTSIIHQSEENSGTIQKGSLGIYKLEGDELTVCSVPSGEGRPKEFVSPEGSKNMLTVYRRVPKEADPSK
jgi:RNA polymerase sigma factor (sigma-70 family)